jgi:hypothetical protein
MARHTIRAVILAMACATAPTTPLHAATPAAEAWEIGPIIRSKNYSVGMPLIPTASGRGWHFDFPYPSVDAGHVHYLTFNHGPLTGKRKIVMRYRIDAPRGVRFVPREHPDLPATLSFFFQRRGDSWSGKGRYEAYRWYSPEHSLVSLRPGEHELVVDLQDSWISVWGHAAPTNPYAFRDAIDGAERVGFVLGSRQGRGHGVYATGPARFTVLSFEVI